MSTLEIKMAFTACKNYDAIVNFNYDKDDILSEQIIETYKKHILDPKSILRGMDLKGLDEAVNEYVENKKFFNFIKNKFNDIISLDMMDDILNLYKLYQKEEFKTFENTDWI